MGANDDVDVGNLSGYLLVCQVTRVTDGHNDVYSLFFQLANLPSESFDLILKNKFGRHVGSPDSFGGEVTHKTYLSSTFLNDEGFLCQTLQLRYFPVDIYNI